MIKIGRIAEKDIEELSSLMEELSELKTDMNAMKRSFRRISDDENYILLGAWIDSRLAGSVMGIFCYDLVGECRPFMVIENVIVSETYRGRGIGKRLMQEIEKYGRESNSYYTMFVSGIKREDAHKFYEAIGYKNDLVKGFKKFL